jgi:hypothetical protein
MNECKSCQKELSDYRYHLGYTECVECSKEEKYSAHQQKIDRRSTGSRTAKGIFSDQSWDRWLDKYYENLNKKPKKKFIHKVVEKNYKPTKEIRKKVLTHMAVYGYIQSLDKLESLYKSEHINFSQKVKINNELVEYQMMNSKDRKRALKEYSV